MFWDAVDRIVVQLREDEKSSKVKVTVVKSVERQNLFWIQEIETLKVSAVTLKYMTDILVIQEKKLQIIKHCLKTLVSCSASESHCLSF